MDSLKFLSIEEKESIVNGVIKSLIDKGYIDIYGQDNSIDFEKMEDVYTTIRQPFDWLCFVDGVVQEYAS